MCKSLSLLILTAVLAGCEATFDMAVYDDSLFDRQGGGNARATEVLNQAIASSERAFARIPPGIYADHGVLLYREGKLAEAVERINKEEEHYPESKQFMQRLLALILKAKSEPEVRASSSHLTPSILILPAINKSGNPEVGPSFDVILNRPFVERGYYVFPLLATGMLLQEAGIKPADVQSVEPAFLRKLTGADALLYVTITEWEHTHLLIPVIRAAAEYRLVDAATGRELWKCAVSGTFDPLIASSVGGPARVVVRDLRVPARSLTRKAITSSNGALPYGPYH